MDPATRRSRRRSPRSGRRAGCGSSGRSRACARSACRSTTRSADIDLTRDDALGRPTIARALIAAGYATSVEDAFRRLIGWGGPAYVPREGMGPREAIEAIRAAGGVPVLAHFSEAPTQMPLLRELQELGLAGLEVYYRTFRPETVDARSRLSPPGSGLLATGGSDYHGDR